MSFAGFSESTFQFLAELARHNEQSWFEAHRADCDSALVEPAKALVEALAPGLKALDPELHVIPRVRGSIKAMERRRRFPNAKRPPYKESLDLWFWSGPRRQWDNSGFYLRLTASRLVLAGGMIEFQKGTLERYREAVLDDERGENLVSIVDTLRAGGYFVGGEGYKRAPRGVPADHPRVGLARHRGLFTTLDIEHPAELRTPRFVDFALAHFRSFGPLHAWLVALGRRQAIVGA